MNDSNSNINNINNIHIEQKNYKNIMAFNGEDKIVSLIHLESGDIATGSNDYKVRILSIKADVCILSFGEFGTVFCLLEFMSKKLLVGTSGNNIGLWDLDLLEF